MLTYEPLGIGWKVKFTKNIGSPGTTGQEHTITSIAPHSKFNCLTSYGKKCFGCTGFDGGKPECSSYDEERGFVVITKTGIGTIREGRDDINIVAMI